MLVTDVAHWARPPAHTQYIYDISTLFHFYDIHITLMPFSSDLLAKIIDNITYDGIGRYPIYLRVLHHASCDKMSLSLIIIFEMKIMSERAHAHAQTEIRRRTEPLFPMIIMIMNFIHFNTVDNMANYMHVRRMGKEKRRRGDMTFFRMMAVTVTAAASVEPIVFDLLPFRAIHSISLSLSLFLILCLSVHLRYRENKLCHLR